MLRASPGRPGRIVISSMALHCARFGAFWGRALLEMRNDVAAKRRPWRSMPAPISLARMNPIRVLLASALALLVVLPPADAARKKKAAPPAAAAEPAPAKSNSGAAEQLGQSGSWTAYQAQDGTGLVCYVVGQPQKTEPANIARKAPMAMVKHRPGEKHAHV